MKYVLSFGQIYRMSDRNFRKLCRDGIEGNVADNWDYYGAKKVADDSENITDWEPDDYESALRLMNV